MDHATIPPAPSGRHSERSEESWAARERPFAAPSLCSGLRLRATERMLCVERFVSATPSPVNALPSRQPRRWEIAPRAPKEHFEAFPDLHPLIVQLLYNRGLHHPDQVAEFLSPDTSNAD